MTRCILRALLFAFAGLTSAAVTEAVNLRGTLSAYAVGLFFGVAVALVLILHDKVRSPLRLAGFIVACTAAFSASVFTAFWGFLAFSAISRSPSNSNWWDTGRLDIDVPFPIVFAAGYVGAFIVLFAALFAVRNVTRSSVGLTAVWALAGGVLAVIGWIPANLPYMPAQPSRDPLTSAALFLVWQTGVALCVAFVVSTQEGQTTAAAPVRSSTVTRVAIAFSFATILAFLGWQITAKIRIYRAQAQREAPRKEMMAEAPPLHNLPSIQPMTDEQALIVEDIAGYFAELPRSSTTPETAATPGVSIGSPPRVSHIISYGVSKKRPYLVGVTVTVDEYPNTAWTRYKAKYPDATIITVAQHVAIVTKFGNRIYQDSSQMYGDGSGTMIFRWPSGSRVVNIRCGGDSRNEEFVKRYLAKYPSSL